MNKLAGHTRTLFFSKNNNKIQTTTISINTTNNAIIKTKKRKWTLQSLAMNNSTSNYSQNSEILLQDVNIRLAQQYEKCLEMTHQVKHMDRRIMMMNQVNQDSSSIHTRTDDDDGDDYDGEEEEEKEKQRLDDKGRKVIKAVNQNIVTKNNFGTLMMKMKKKKNDKEMNMITTHMKNYEIDQKAALKGLKNLEILHSDTFKV